MSTELPAFREVQSTTGTLTVVAAVFAAPVLLLAAVVVHGVFGGFTPRALDWMAAAVALVVTPVVLLRSASLVTEVREDGLAVKFFPLQWTFHRVAPEEVTSAEVIDLRAAGLSGTVGIRYRPLSAGGLSLGGPKVYLAGEADGAVRIEREDRRPLVVGSRRPRELRAALEAVRESGERSEDAAVANETV